MTDRSEVYKAYEKLADAALGAKALAYAPYSGFRVGAALLTNGGKTYTGANIESAAYSATCCAERVAFFKAVSEGERGFAAIAVAGSKDCQPTDYCFPCGICRQVMSEFCGGDFIILAVKSPGDWQSFRLDELLPHGFSLE